MYGVLTAVCPETLINPVRFCAQPQHKAKWSSVKQERQATVPPKGRLLGKLLAG